ncbi:unnamed protein product [Lampetra fluviatilis]
MSGAKTESSRSNVLGGGRLPREPASCSDRAGGPRAPWAFGPFSFLPPLHRDPRCDPTSTASHGDADQSDTQPHVGSAPPRSSSLLLAPLSPGAKHSSCVQCDD